MTCPHCNTANSSRRDQSRPVEGGRVYAQVCRHCGRVIGLRPRLDSDPLPSPNDLSDAQIARLRFVRWRLVDECAAQVHRAGEPEADFPSTAA